jgi:hypothetical protein
MSHAAFMLLWWYWSAGTPLGPVTAKNIVEPLGPNWFVEIR